MPTAIRRTGRRQRRRRAALAPADLARPDLRGPEADVAASAVAAIPAVRSALLDFQRGFARGSGAVLDGRDICTVIFPDARVKLFVTADLPTRARRRWLELRAKGVDISLDAVEEEMRIRDARDAARVDRAVEAGAGCRRAGHDGARSGSRFRRGDADRARAHLLIS